jgi:adenylate cyclase
MRETVHVINARTGEEPMTLGIGICTGLVIAGNVGTRQRANYTVLGTAVNRAARLEKAARPIQDGILISDSTYAHVNDTFRVQRRDDLDGIRQDESLVAYEVLGKL